MLTAFVSNVTRAQVVLPRHFARLWFATKATFRIHCHQVRSLLEKWPPRNPAVTRKLALLLSFLSRVPSLARSMWFTKRCWAEADGKVLRFVRDVRLSIPSHDGHHRNGNIDRHVPPTSCLPARAGELLPENVHISSLPHSVPAVEEPQDADRQGSFFSWGAGGGQCITEHKNDGC